MRKVILTKKTDRGFTLIELVVTLIVMGIAVGIAVPSYRALNAGSDLSATARNLVAAIQFARSQSLSLRTNATFEAADGNAWSSGLKASYTKGGQTTERHWNVNTGNTLSLQTDNGGGGPVSIVFQSNGFIDSSGTPLTFMVCDGRTGETGWTVTLSKNGLVETKHDANCN